MPSGPAPEQSERMGRNGRCANVLGGGLVLLGAAACERTEEYPRTEYYEVTLAAWDGTSDHVTIDVGHVGGTLLDVSSAGFNTLRLARARVQRRTTRRQRARP